LAKAQERRKQVYLRKLRVTPVWVDKIDLNRPRRGLAEAESPERQRERLEHFRKRQWRLGVDHALWQYRHAKTKEEQQEVRRMFAQELRSIGWVIPEN
jgi:hypothetical protein